MEASTESLELDYIQAQEHEREQEQELDIDDLIPGGNKRSSAFDVSPYAEGQERLSRRLTQVLDPRLSLPPLTSTTTEKRNFSHPLTRQKTSSEALVDFDGPDDPYRPLNWPARKKVITVLLYGLTTTCSSWATSVYSDTVSLQVLLAKYPQIFVRCQRSRKRVPCLRHCVDPRNHAIPFWVSLSSTYLNNAKPNQYQIWNWTTALGTAQ